MHFQLSVFYQGSLFLYSITSDDKHTFHFQLKSAPPDKTAPQEFNVLHPEKDVWNFEQELDQEFKEGVIKVMKRTKL
jgi:hypothetical protein